MGQSLKDWPIVMSLLISMIKRLRQMLRILRMPWPICLAMLRLWSMIMQPLKMLMWLFHRLVIFNCSIMLVKIVLLNFHLPEKQSIKFLKNSKSWILKVSLWLFQILLMPYQLFTKNSLVGQRNVSLEQEHCLIRPVWRQQWQMILMLILNQFQGIILENTVILSSQLGVRLRWKAKILQL